ncbi:MAG: HlyD family secretion protein [Croceibacterium sp.]
MAEAAEPLSPPRRRVPKRAIAAIVIVAIAGVGLWLLLRSEDRGGNEHFTGYVVADDVYMTSPIAGTLASVAVVRGQRVAAGAALFQVDPTQRAAGTEQAQAQISANQAQVNQQQSALAKAREDLAAAQADADRQGAQLKRLTASQAEKAGSVAQLDIDQARAAYQAAQSRTDAARAQLGAASAAINAARAQVQGAQAGLTSARRQLNELAPVAPSAGRVEDVMFKPGETVPPNVPIVSIVPDGEVKVRLYVPQALVNAYEPGRKVAISCDGCAAGMTATVNFVATEPEYTPPVIYSLDARQKLVFMVEAVPSSPRALVPGQPIDVAPSAGDLPHR